MCDCLLVGTQPVKRGLQPAPIAAAHREVVSAVAEGAESTTAEILCGASLPNPILTDLVLVVQ